MTGTPQPARSKVPWGPLLLAIASTAAACEGRRQVPVPGVEGAQKSSSEVRAARRAYDGAPPTMPHEDFGMDCRACHGERGMAVDGVGFAPASPHGGTSAIGDRGRCRQCHVLSTTDEEFAASGFLGLPQDLREGGRFSLGSPPTIPHGIFMRENCVACHTGPAAREEVRTSHPERARCRQCHVPEQVRSEFRSDVGTGMIYDSASAGNGDGENGVEHTSPATRNQGGIG